MYHSGQRAVDVAGVREWMLGRAFAPARSSLLQQMRPSPDA